jgi:hypothetical protein
MNSLETLLSWLSVTFQVALCVFVFARRTQRVLPFFAAYACFLAVGTISVLLVYIFLGLQSLAAYYCYWASILLNAVVRSLAIAELCRYKLSAYRGIWGLVWRLLAVLSIVFLAHAAYDTWGQPNRFAIYALTFDRDLDIASVAILAALLLIHNYYGLSLEPLQRTIAAGICFICAVDIGGETILRTLFTSYLWPAFGPPSTPLWCAVKPSYDRITDLWSAIHILCFLVAIGIWCFALRKPIPGRSEDPVLLPAELYEEMSPAINFRLRAFNDRLVELLKP